MQTTISNESITFIMTDASLEGKIKEYFSKYQYIKVDYISIKSEGEIKEFLKDMKENTRKQKDQYKKYIWVISENEQEIAEEILLMGQASIVAKENGSLEQSIEYSIKYYPCLDLPFQKNILMTVYNYNKPHKREDLSVCLGDCTDFNQTEKDIIYYLLQGKTADQIAAQTFNSVHTINNNIVKIKRKLNVHSKIEIITHFVKQKIG
ncbi:helix-turn-helix transcriptional regulator [Alkalihalophilus pseudofirmus]|uniref:helix-turn-helix transcriptional regulator n=1 Tax=Alkalihalophilus pseudofirmus TaxID=79885 RepID=UPI00259B6083|nr:helix-turn-helix transcriptional regulator [Alkalihalophilus pseudofirmus]WEG16564.1 helix-turn-helix transcriptional regulator [Alkalihalophilus pseudofirmus]